MTQATVDSLVHAPDASYSRSDGEIAFQKAYEAREATRARSVVQITYRIDHIPSRIDASYIAARNAKEGAWIVVRQVGDGKEEKTAPMYRPSEAVTAVREAMWRDKKAAERLGIDIYLVAAAR